VRVYVAAGGRIEPGGPEPSAVISLSGISGSGPLAEELRYLARHLRPDMEEELSRVVGDVAAQRIGDSVRALARWQRDAAQRAGEALADYAVDEQRLLVRRAELAQLTADIARLGDALMQLEQRIARLD
jgi:ubiquinone biosynthesis protein UbiJ